MATVHPMLNIDVKTARRAASLINRASRGLDEVTVARKRQNRFVSNVNHAFLSEESSAAGPSECERSVDPRDGTTNFIRGVRAGSQPA